MHVYPSKSEDDFLDNMPYETAMDCLAFAHRYQAAVIGG